MCGFAGPDEDVVEAQAEPLDFSEEDGKRGFRALVVTLCGRRSQSVEGGDLGGRPSTADAIRHALEAAGVEFTNGERPGVRLRK